MINPEPFKKKLEAEKTRLENEMSSVGRRNPAVPGDWEPSAPADIAAEADPIDQAEVVTDRDTNAAVLVDLEARYAAVNAALQRIEKGTYGTCSVCGKAIKKARLEADPAAATCVEHVNSA